MELRTVSLISILLGLATMTGARAQERPQPVATVSQTALMDAHGLDRVDGELWGIGRDFKTRFHTTGIEFVPALGQGTPRPLPVHLELASVRRESAPAVGFAPAGIREVEETTVHYRRSGFVETFEVRPDGVEHSFTFDALPEGSGDLIVALRADTELEPGRTDADDLTFVRDGVGGVRFGAVTGIDATGATTRGSLRRTHEGVEYVLPASFVDRAVLPLVLDPLIGTTITIASSWNEILPDAAYDATNDVYFVVWGRSYGANNSDLYGQRVRSDGQLVGGPFRINTSSTSPQTGRVANVNVRDTFVVVWAENEDIWARGVNAATGRVSAFEPVARGANSQRDPDVGGAATRNHGEAITTWYDHTTRHVYAAGVRVNADGSLSLLGTAQITGPAGGWQPSISKSGGSTAWYLVAWNTANSIKGRFVDRNLNMPNAEFWIAGLSRREIEPAVDGDGSSWVVAWQQAELGSPSDYDIGCRRVTRNPFSGNAMLGDRVELEAAQSLTCWSASVAWLGDSYLVGYLCEWATGAYSFYVHSVDPFNCGRCEGRFTLDLTTLGSIRLASMKSGDTNAADDALAVYSRYLSSNPNGVVRARRFRAADGLVTNLRGGCPNGGRAFATCSVQGNLDFEHQLLDSVGNSTAFLLLAFDRLDVPCGPCVLVPDPVAGFVLGPVLTDARGDASMPTPIAAYSSLIGLRFVEQWVVIPRSASGACPELRASFSNALQVEIQ